MPKSVSCLRPETWNSRSGDAFRAHEHNSPLTFQMSTNNLIRSVGVVHPFFNSEEVGSKPHRIQSMIAFPLLLDARANHAIREGEMLANKEGSSGLRSSVTCTETPPRCALFHMKGDVKKATVLGKAGSESFRILIDSFVIGRNVNNFQQNPGAAFSNRRYHLARWEERRLMSWGHVCEWIVLS